MHVTILILVLIAIGVSLDTFALMVTQGSLMPKINFKTILSYIGVFSFWQIISVLAGSMLAKYPLGVYIRKTLNKDYVFSAVLILVLGVFVISKTLDTTKFLERRMDLIDFRNVHYLGMVTSFDTFLVSFSMTLSSIGLTVLIVFALISTIVSIILGMYTGYAFGYKLKYRLRYLSAMILIISGIGIII